MPQHYELALAFDTDNAEFVRGFEAGRVWAEVGQTDDPYTATVHTGNAEMMMRIAEARGLKYRADPWYPDDMWITIHFE